MFSLLGRVPARRFRPSPLLLAAVLAAVLAAFVQARPAAAQPAVADAVEARFPDPQQVLQDFPKQPERTAALIVLRDELLAQNGHRVDAKVMAYNKAFQQVQAEQRAQGVTLDWGGMTKAQRRISYVYSDDPHAKPFHRKVLNRYLADHNSMAAEDAARAADDAASAAGLATIALGLVLAAAVAAAPWIVARLRHPTVAPPAIPDNLSGDTLSLPEPLRQVRLTRLAYPVEWVRGLVFDARMWNEVQVEVTTSGGGASVGPAIGPYGSQTVTVHPTQVHTRTRNIRKDEIWLRTPEGRELDVTFTGGEFRAAVGQTVSLLAADDGAWLLGFNHASGVLTTFETELRHRNRLPGGLPWLAAVAVGLAGILLIESLTGVGRELGKPGLLGLLMLLAPPALIAWISTGIAKAVYQGARNRVFRRVYAPAYRRVFERATPDLKACFGVGDMISAAGD